LIAYNKTFEELHLQQPTKKPDIFSDSTDEITFISTKPKHTFEQIILKLSLVDEIESALIIVKNKQKIYEDWGFNEIDSEPRAVLNFYGPPGTGKTMTAHAIASKLDCKILNLNYAEIESKYVGDAPKNLTKAFETAKKENCVLFFDEADSFLGKRIANVSQSSDQAVNSLRSQMLILLEQFTGIVIFATNLVTNYDRAFESRILKHLKFELPDIDERTKIIKKTIPMKVPFETPERLTDSQINILAEISDNFSGREIKNAVLSALTAAIIDARDFVKFDDFESAFQKTKSTLDQLHKETNPLNISPTGKAILEKRIKEELTKETKKESKKESKKKKK
jgi:AAA+ superfamily predicted ATPase